MKPSKGFRIVVGLALSAIFLYFSVRDVDFAEVMQSLRGAHYIYLIPAMASVVLAFLVRSLRWRIILKPVKEVGVTNAFSATMIGFMANNVLPMRAGELVRAVVIGRQESISRSAALATIVVERVFDMVALLVILFLGAMGLGLPEELRHASWIVAAATAVALVVLGFLARTRRRAGVAVARLPGGHTRIGTRLSRLVDSFQDGLGVLGNLQDTLFTLALSGVVWGCFVATYWFSLAAFDLDLGLRAPILLLGVVSIGVMLPSAPGYIGTMQWFFMMALRPFHVDENLALSASFFFWVAQYVPVTVIGLVYFARENMNFRSVLREERSASAAAPGDPVDRPVGSGVVDSEQEPRA